MHSTDTEDAQQQRVPTLVQLCQRGELSTDFGGRTWLCFPDNVVLAASAHVDCEPIIHKKCEIRDSWDFIAICGLGNDLTYKLVKPILDRCTIEQLLRFEQLSPVSSHPRYVPPVCTDLTHAIAPPERYTR
jgi:hypothetical protein